MQEASIPCVGNRIRTLRERQALSLRALAERSGLSVNAISLIERGESSPTVSSLHQLATALGVHVGDFFADEHEQVAVFVRPGARLQSQANGIGLESLGLGLRNQQLQPFLLTVAPGAGNLDQPVTHAGEEFVYCLHGEVQYCVADRVFRLRAEDSLLFRACQPHCFHNPTGTTARLMLVFSASDNGQHARRLHLGATA